MTPATTKTPSQLLTEALAKETPPDRIGRCLSEAMGADMVNRDGTKSPDHKTRIFAANLAIQFSVGRAVERIESININADADSAVGMEDRLRHSPALRALFRKMLDRVEGSQCLDV